MLETMLKSRRKCVENTLNMTLKQISYEIFFQRRFNVSLLFFNVVSTLKQRRCACREAGK